jgi:hypothetical protein
LGLILLGGNLKQYKFLPRLEACLLKLISFKGSDAEIEDEIEDRERERMQEGRECSWY